jgi:hypothetical protein
MSKQDRQGARTVPDLERRYNFGKSFAEILGMATDARSAAEKASQAVETLDTSLSADEIFNRLTDNGKVQGIYRGEDGQVYINASYILSGELLADLIKGGTLSSKNGKIQIDLGDGESMPIFNTGISVNGITVRGDATDEESLFEVSVHLASTGQYFSDLTLKSATGEKLLAISETFESDDLSQSTGISIRLASIDGAYEAILGSYNSHAGLWLYQNGEIVGSVIASEGGVALNVSKVNGKTVSWKSNGDGTYSLIGT